MRKILVALAMLTLSGCAAMIDDLYDDHARSECDRDGRDRGGCYDRVDAHRRERDRGN